MTIKFQRIPSPNGRVSELPRFATAGSAGADLCANLDEPLTLSPMGRAMVPTGLALELPDAQQQVFADHRVQRPVNFLAGFHGHGLSALPFYSDLYQPLQMVYFSQSKTQSVGHPQTF